MRSVKGRYELADVLGEGGMGVVYRALDKQMGREVALKTIRDSTDQAVLDLFRRECAVLSSLNHPNIVDIYDIGEFGNRGQEKPYFVMPLLPGAPLSALITGQTQRLTPERVVEIMTQALRGLQAAHEKGLIHRDLKPSNIFVLDDDSVKIIDFGVAHLVNSHSTIGLKGTLFYMAPEQLEMQTATALSDVFAMGVVCYETLTRRRPFTGATNEELVEAIRKYVPPPASEINPAVGSMLGQIVHAAMAKMPWHRFSSAREFADSLQKALHDQPIERFNPIKLESRLQRAKAALSSSEYEFASEILTEMESEGHVHPEIRPLRKQIDQANRNRTIRQLLDSAERRLKDDEYQLALEKIHQVVQIDPRHPDALRMKTDIEAKRSSQQIDNWLQLASDHLENYSFSHARQALQKVMDMKPGDSRALHLLETVDRNEQNYLSIKRQKEQRYQAALERWKQGEVTSALSQAEMLMALDRECPERSDVEKAAAYQDLFNKVRSEHESLKDAYSEAKKCLSDGNFASGLAITDKHLEKYPHHALFQSLRLDIEEAERQALSSFIAKIDREVQAEPDLDRKVSMLEAALVKHPGEPHFEQALKSASARRSQINAIVARARNLEDRGQHADALNQWEMLRTIYQQYPGLEFEIERINSRKELQAAADRKTRMVEQADAALKSNDFALAIRIIVGAQAEYKDDAELAPIEKLARDGLARQTRAEELIREGQGLIADANFDGGLKLLEQAYQLVERSQYTRAALLEALLSRASALAHSDLKKAESLVQQALSLDGTNPQAKSLRRLIADRKRDAAIHTFLSRARQLQADGRVEAAAAEVRSALEAHPGEPRLNQLLDILQQAQGESHRREEREQDLQSLFSIEEQFGANADPNRLQQLHQQSALLAEKYPEDAPFQDGYTKIDWIWKRMAQSPSQVEGPDVDVTKLFEMADALPPNHDASHSGLTSSPAPILPPQGSPATGKSLLSIQVKRKELAWRVGALVGVVVLISAALFLVQSRGTKRPRSGNQPTLLPVVFRSNVTGANLQLDGKPINSLQQSLKTGTHTLQGSAVGYLPATKTFTVAPGEATPLTVSMTLVPAPTELRINSDLRSGQMVLDGSATELVDGDATTGSIGPGRHSLAVIEDGRELVSFDFTSRIGGPPELASPVTAKDVPVVVISSLGTTAKIWSSEGMKGGPTESAMQPIAAGGVSLTGLVPGAVSFLVEGRKSERRSLAIDPASVPTLRLEMGTQPQTGTLVVQSNVPDAVVVVSGHALKQPMKKGVKVLTLDPNLYQIRVTHPDYQEVAEQAVEVKRKETKSLNFELLPIVRMGSLTLEKFPPETQVLMDGNNSEVPAKMAT